MGIIKKSSIKWNHRDGAVLYPIVEAPSSLLFTVSKEDVKEAKKRRGIGDPNQCVAACSLRRQFADAVFQRDTGYILTVSKGKINAFRYRFGNALKNAIVNFDNGDIFPEGTYKLLAPSPSQTLEAKRGKKKIGKTKRFVRPHLKFNARGKVPAMS